MWCSVIYRYSCYILIWKIGKKMLNVRLAGGHLYGKQLFTWLSLVMSLMASFCAVLFRTRCLGCDLGRYWVSFWGISYLLFHTFKMVKIVSWNLAQRWSNIRRVAENKNYNSGSILNGITSLVKTKRTKTKTLASLLNSKQLVSQETSMLGLQIISLTGNNVLFSLALLLIGLTFVLEFPKGQY